MWMRRSCCGGDSSAYTVERRFSAALTAGLNDDLGL